MSALQDSSIEVRLRARWGAFELDVDFCSDARSVGIFGPSGSGKTSVLEALVGWRRVPWGRVRIGGQLYFDSERGVDLPSRARGIGFVPQDALLFPHWSVRDNITAARRGRAGPGDASPGEAEQSLALAVEVLELGPLLERSVDGLSGGERQRVALARALASAPRWLVLDEPFGALDVPLRRRVLPYLIRVLEAFDVPLLFVSHDATEVQALCEEVVCLAAGRAGRQGKAGEVLSAGAAELENVLRGTVRHVREHTAEVELAPGCMLEVPRQGLEVGEPAVLAVAADDVLIALDTPRRISARNVLDGRVAELVRGDHDVRVGVDVRPAATSRPGGGGPPMLLWAQLTHASVAELGLAAGVPATVIVKTSACRVLSR